MSEQLGRMRLEKRSGLERFTDGGRDLDFDLLSFWQWSASDLVSNTARGVLAEYLVARALDVDVAGVRDPWAAYDLLTPQGIKVEVKSAAYLQSWTQVALSRVQFLTPKTKAWSADTNELETEAKRQADVYVFALLAHDKKATVDPIDVGQLEFYVLATPVLNARTRSQHSVTLPTLKRMAHSVPYAGLAQAVREAATQP